MPVICHCQVVPGAGFQTADVAEGRALASCATRSALATAAQSTAAARTLRGR